MHKAIVSFASLVLCVSLVDEASGAVKTRTARAVRRPGPIVVDGVPDEKAWQAAPVNTSFTHPISKGRLAGELASGKPVPKQAQTEFRVLFDDTTLYIGVVCHEPHPDQIRLQMIEA